jgi:hypothetical protein
LGFLAGTFYEKYAKRNHWPNLIYWFDKDLYIMDNISLQNQSSQA